VKVNLRRVLQGLASRKGKEAASQTTTEKKDNQAGN
jgi:hypothetical protein